MLYLRHRDGVWAAGAAPAPREKGPANNGGFRSAFQRNPQLVYGTGGTAEENAWALAQARFDAEWLWYQGNGAVDVLPDTMFDPEAEPERDVVLYGHHHRHRLWSRLVPDGPQISEHSLKIGQKGLMDSSPAVLNVRPRHGSEQASVAMVAAGSEPGRRLLRTRPYLRLGVAYPDLVVMKSDGSVMAAGFYENDWRHDEEWISWSW